ncbi:hypothetical protein HAX54_019683, partial [Datura stramonium]|nr:hypothetical protein [Datura stramonium]
MGHNVSSGGNYTSIRPSGPQSSVTQYGPHGLILVLSDIILPLRAWPYRKQLSITQTS